MKIYDIIIRADWISAKNPILSTLASFKLASHRRSFETWSRQTRQE